MTARLITVKCSRCGDFFHADDALLDRQLRGLSGVRCVRCMPTAVMAAPRPTVEIPPQRTRATRARWKDVVTLLAFALMGLLIGGGMALLGTGQFVRGIALLCAGLSQAGAVALVRWSA